MNAQPPDTAPAKRWLYLPIDVKVRECEAKTWLALRAAQRGYNVVIGQKQKFPSILSCYPRGFYVGFAAMENFRGDYARFRSKGHKIILMDEEGLVTHSEEMYVRNRLNENILDLCDVFVAWGQKQVEILNRVRPGLSARVCTAGNPRFDVLKSRFQNLYAEDVQHIRERYGNYILVNSNFGSCNHFAGGPAYLESLRKKKVIRTPGELDYFHRYFEYRTKIMNEILHILPALRTAFPAHAIIIRPHPSERHETWVEHTKNLENIHVIHEGSVVPWLLAAGAILHNFCTTALEAFALGKTPIAYRPLLDEALETPLPSLASIQAFNEKELVEKTGYVLAGGADPERLQKIKTLSEFIANMDQQDAADLILDRLETFPASAQGLRTPLAVPLHSLRKIAEKIKATLRGKSNNAYAAHKFGELSIEEVWSMARKMEQVPGEFSNFSMSMVHDNCVLIKGAGP